MSTQSNKDNRSKLAALHEWSHHDTTSAEGGESAKVLADDVLRSIIGKQKGAPARADKETQPGVKSLLAKSSTTPAADKSPGKANAEKKKSLSTAAASKSPTKPPQAEEPVVVVPAEKVAPPAFTQTPSPAAAPKSLLAELDLSVCAARAAAEAAEEASQRRRALDREQALREAVICKHSKTAKKKIRDAYGLEETRDERGGKKARKAVALPNIQYPRALDDVAPEELEQDDDDMPLAKRKEKEKAQEIEVVEIEEDAVLPEASAEKSNKAAEAQDEDVEMADAVEEDEATAAVQLNRSKARRLSDVTRSVASDDEWQDDDKGEEADGKEVYGGKRFDVTQHAAGSILFVYSKCSVASSTSDAPTPEL